MAMAHWPWNTHPRPPVHPEGGHQVRLAMLLCRNAILTSYRAEFSEEHHTDEGKLLRNMWNSGTKVLPPWFAPTGNAT